MRTVICFAFAAALAGIACSSTSERELAKDQSLPPPVEHAFEAPVVSAAPRARPAIRRVLAAASGETLALLPLTAPGPYALASVANGDLVASRLDRTLLVDPSGGIRAELDFGGHVAADPSGNLYVAGELPQAAAPGDLDGFVVKLSAELDELWRHEFRTAALERPRAVAVTTDGSALVMGSGIGTVLLSSAGELRWTSNVAGSDLAVTGSDTAIVAGGFIDELVLGSDEHYSDQPGIFVCELDAEGQVVWSRAFSGSSTVYADQVAVDPNGDIWLLGSFRGDLSFGGDTLSYVGDGPDLIGFVAKLGPNGEHLLSRTTDITTSFELIAAPDGDLIFTGNQNDASPLLDLRVIASDGSERWRKSGPEEIQLGKGYGHDLVIEPQGSIAWSIDAYSVEHAGSVLLPFVAKVAR